MELVENRRLKSACCRASESPVSGHAYWPEIQIYVDFDRILPESTQSDGRGCDGCRSLSFV